MLPANLNTTFYYLGLGGTSMMIAGGLWIVGKINHNDNLKSTAFDITKAFITSAVLSQAIKRITGRQSPFMATKPGGQWSFFPSFKDYQSNTSNFDAFPSGHLTTMMATVTVLARHFPNSKWIKPVGYSLIGLTGWAMLNNQVHWLSDYPLAIALGYLSGKAATLNFKKSKTNKQTNK